jgi:hypothetical protein
MNKVKSKFSSYILNWLNLPVNNLYSLENIKDELNKKQKEMYDINKTNEEFKQKTRAKALAYYYRKKAEKKALESAAEAATNE